MPFVKWQFSGVVRKMQMKERLNQRLGWAFGFMLLVSMGALWAARPSGTVEDEWRSAYPSITQSNVGFIHVGHGEFELLLRRDHGGWTAAGAPVLYGDRVDELVGTLTHLEVGFPIDAIPSSEFGLAPPRYTVVLGLTDGTEHGLSVGDATPDEMHEYVSIGETLYVSRSLPSRSFDGVLDAARANAPPD